MAGEGSGRTVVVTGGTGALGRGVVEEMLDAAYRVTVTWIVEDEAAASREAFGSAIDLVRLDVEDEAAVRRLAADLGDGGEPSGVVHLVGGFLADRPVVDITIDEWERMMLLNATSFLNVLRAFLPGMVARGAGSVVGVGTRAASTPFAGGSAYAASKAALATLVQAASEEVKHDGVRVNAVVPSVIDTPANRAAMPDAAHERWVAPREIGRVIRFLCSDASRAVTGAAIPVYGRA